MSRDQLLNRRRCKKIQKVAASPAGKTPNLDAAEIKRPRKAWASGKIAIGCRIWGAIQIINCKAVINANSRVFRLSCLLPITRRHQTQKKQPREHCDAWPGARLPINL